MTWSYAYTPLLWPSVGTVLFMLFLSVYTWQRRSVPGAIPLMIGCLFAIGWSAGSVMEYAAVDFPTKVAWFVFQAANQLPIVTAITCFFLEYAWPGRWLTRRSLALLSIPCLLALLLAATNGFHHLSWLSLTYVGKVIAEPGPITWGFMVYAFVGLGTLNLIVFAWLFQRSPQHRWPVALMVTGQVVGRTVFALDTAGVFASVLPHNILGMVFEFLMYTIALFGFRILNPIPMARNTVIEQLHAGMLVLDTQAKVISLNPAAEQILGVRLSRARGQHIRELLPISVDEFLTRSEDIEIELNLGAGQSVCHYILAISRLCDWRGLEAGHLLMLRDVTQRKMVEIALNETQEIQRLIFENTSEGIAIYEEFPQSKTRKLLDCNARYVEMSGRSKEMLLEIGDTMRVQNPLPPVPYARSRQDVKDAQSEGFFTWVRPDGQDNTIEYKSETIRLGGRLLSIGLDRDVTERTRVQAQILEQQRALAMLHEREQLARELHDSTGQVLGYAILKVGATRKLIADGKLAQADDQLARLESAISDANADLREYILNLRAASVGNKPFFSTLQHYLDGYRQNYGIQVAFSFDEDVNEDLFSMEAQLQLLRILQEALSNTRKHARADCVQITFWRENSRLLIRIQDNGQGFDPSQAFNEENDRSSREHFGLRFMRERAEALGGSLRVQSATGAGTCIEVDIPVQRNERCGS